MADNLVNIIDSDNSDDIPDSDDSDSYYDYDSDDDTYQYNVEVFSLRYCQKCLDAVDIISSYDYDFGSNSKYATSNTELNEFLERMDRLAIEMYSSKYTGIDAKYKKYLYTEDYVKGDDPNSGYHYYNWRDEDEVYQRRYEKINCPCCRDIEQLEQDAIKLYTCSLYLAIENNSRESAEYYLSKGADITCMCSIHKPREFEYYFGYYDNYYESEIVAGYMYFSGNDNFDNYGYLRDKAARKLYIELLNEYSGGKSIKAAY